MRVHTLILHRARSLSAPGLHGRKPSGPTSAPFACAPEGLHQQCALLLRGLTAVFFAHPVLSFVFPSRRCCNQSNSHVFHSTLSGGETVTLGMGDGKFNGYSLASRQAMWTAFNDVQRHSPGHTDLFQMLMQHSAEGELRIRFRDSAQMFTMILASYPLWLENVVRWLLLRAA